MNFLMGKTKLIFVLIFGLFQLIIHAQNQSDSSKIEIYVIDSYVTVEQPYIFHLTFFTSDSSTSKLFFDNKYYFPISSKLTENHKFQLNLSNYSFDSLFVPYKIIVFNKDGRKTESEEYELELSYKEKQLIGKSPGVFSTICLGGLIFSIPSPGIAVLNGKSYFTLSKELPLLSFNSLSSVYPIGYFDLEYSYLFNATKNNFLRFGYKQVIPFSPFKFLSPGIDYITNFEGENGISIELSIGITKLYDSFTLFIKYRYNLMLNKNPVNFSEVSLGLYSNFFSFSL